MVSAQNMVGRVFAHQDNLYFVVCVDSETGFARAVRTNSKRREVIEIPITEINWHLMNAQINQERTSLEQFDANQP